MMLVLILMERLQMISLYLSNENIFFSVLLKAAAIKRKQKSHSTSKCGNTMALSLIMSHSTAIGMGGLCFSHGELCMGLNFFLGIILAGSKNVD